MADHNYTLHWIARDTFLALNPDEQAQVRDKLQALTEIPPWQWPDARIISPPGAPPDYLVPVNESLRLVVRATPGQPIEVGDFLRQETIDSFTKTHA